MQDWLIDYYAKQRLAQIMPLGAAMGLPAVPANWATQSGGNWVSTVGTPGKLFIQIPLLVGRRITGVTVYFKHATATGGLVTAVLNRHTIDGDLRFAESNVASSAASTAIQAIALTGITSVAALATDVFEVAFDGTATVDTRTVYGVKITFDYP